MARTNQSKTFKVSDILDEMYGPMDTQPVEPVNPDARKMREGWLPFLGATGMRLGSGLVSGIVGAVPSFITTPTAAAIAGGGEALAQKIESPDPINEKLVAVEGGLGAIPFGNLVRAGKAGVPLAKTALTNAARLAGFIESGNIMRRVAQGENALPDTLAEGIFDAATTGLGWKLGGRVPHMGQVADDVAEEASVVGKYTNLGGRKDIAEPGSVIAEVPSPAINEMAAQLPEVLPQAGPKGVAPAKGVVRVGSAKPTRVAQAEEIQPGVQAISGGIVNASANELDATMGESQKLKDAATSIWSKFVNDRNKLITDYGGNPSPAPIYNAEIQDPNYITAVKKLEDARDLALTKSRLAERTRQGKADAKVLKAEETADRQAGGTDLGKIKVAEAKAQEQVRKEIVEKEKAHTQAAKMVDEEKRQVAAQRAIDQAIENNELVPSPPVVKEVTASVPTVAGKQTLTTTFRPKDADAEEFREAVINRIEPIQASTGSGKPRGKYAVEKLDPAYVAGRTWPSRMAAMDAANGTGRRVSEFKQLRHGKWQVIFEDAAEGGPKPPPAAAGEPVLKEPEPIKTLDVQGTQGGKATVEKPVTPPATKIPETPQYPDEPPTAPPPAPTPVKPKPAPKKPSGGAAAPAGEGLGGPSAAERLKSGPDKQRATQTATPKPTVPLTPEQRIAAAEAKMQEPAKTPVTPPTKPPVPVTVTRSELPKPVGGAPVQGIRLAPQKPAGEIPAPVKGKAPVQPKETPVAAPKAPAEAPKASSKMSKREIDAVTREDVQKWSAIELDSAATKYSKNKRLQTIIADERKRRLQAQKDVTVATLEKQGMAAKPTAEPAKPAPETLKVVEPETKLSERGFPLHNGEELSWNLGSYDTWNEKQLGYPKVKAVIRATRNIKDGALAKERLENLRDSGSKQFGPWVDEELAKRTDLPKDAPVRGAKGSDLADMSGKQLAKQLDSDNSATALAVAEEIVNKGGYHKVSTDTLNRARSILQRAADAKAIRVRVDLAGAKSAKDVKDRVVAALKDFRAKVEAYEDSAGVSEKGVRTLNEELNPGRIAIEVPGGPTYYIKPDLAQIDNAIAKFESAEGQAAMKGLSGEKPSKAGASIPKETNWGTAEKPTIMRQADADRLGKTPDIVEHGQVVGPKAATEEFTPRGAVVVRAADSPAKLPTTAKHAAYIKDENGITELYVSDNPNKLTQFVEEWKERIRSNTNYYSRRSAKREIEKNIKEGTLPEGKTWESYLSENSVDASKIKLGVVGEESFKPLPEPPKSGGGAIPVKSRPTKAAEGVPKSSGNQRPLDPSAEAEAKARVAAAGKPEEALERAKKSAQDYIKTQTPEEVEATKKRVAEAKARLTEGKATEGTSKLADLALKEKEAWDHYFDVVKPAAKAGTMTQEELRAAGKAAGELKAQLAKAVKEAQAKGEPIPTFLQKQAEAPAPKAKVPTGKGPTSDDIAKMSPAEQESTIQKAVDEFKAKKGRTKNEKGELTTELAVNLGLAAMGGFTGSLMADDPITGFLTGAAVGLAPGAVYRVVSRHLDSLPAKGGEKSREALGKYVKEKATAFGEIMPDAYRASLLSKPQGLLVNSLVGPYGAALMGSIEHAIAGDARGVAAFKELINPVNFGKEFFSKETRAEAAKHVFSASERADMIGGKGPKAFQKVIRFPAETMTTGDVASRKILMKHGFSEKEARQITLTSEPYGKAISDFVRAGEPSQGLTILKRMALPFFRTSQNQIEQSFMRAPVLGFMAESLFKNPPRSAALKLAQQGVGGGMVGIGYAIGSVTPPEDRAAWTKFLVNFGGPYGTLIAAGFIAGYKSQTEPDIDKQLQAGIVGAVNELPLPTGDALLTIGKAAAQTATAPLKLALKGELKEQDIPDLPFGFVPPMLSSKEWLSVPSIMRDPEGVAKGTIRPTQKEYSLLAPFIDKPELKDLPRSASERSESRKDLRVRQTESYKEKKEQRRLKQKEIRNRRRAQELE